MLHWTNISSSTVDFAIVAATTGYVALGWSKGGGMTPSEAVVAYSGQSPSVSAYKLTAKETSGVVPNPSLFPVTKTSVAADAKSGTTVVKFTRAFDTGTYPFVRNTTTALIWACSPDNSNALADHGSNKGSFHINFASGSSAPATDAARDTFRKAHVFFMYAAFAALLPAAVFIARFGQTPRMTPRWFHLHLTFTILGVVCATVGFVLAVSKLGSMGTSHARIGILLIVLVWAQGPLGAVRPHKAARTRPYWYYLHWLIGTAVIVLGFVESWLGISLYKTFVLGGGYTAWRASLGVEAGVLLALYGALELLRRRQKGAVTAATTPPLTPDSTNDGAPAVAAAAAGRSSTAGLLPPKAEQSFFVDSQRGPHP